ncbi:DNA ligase D [Shumkonia mesophila]|uniref:DNA ligase D n=1 Tax=Shumkonia mesophila TaxID=2838854 RepID=UPI0029349E65|nr:DNA ligase D [Shumkonia mesophila]
MARAPSKGDPLATYHAKRRFGETPEPKGRAARAAGHLYTIQKHAARRLHYDLRLELDGVLKSWAVTRGPSLDPADKRLAVRTEDHPVDYATFEGRIPEGNYGAGTVLLWDRGTWEPLEDPHAGLKKGKLVFQLYGERLRGRWALVRFRGKDSGPRENWLLVKEVDEEVRRQRDVTAEHATSVASGRAIDEVTGAPKAEWSKGGQVPLTPKKREARRRSTAPAFVEPALATLVEDVPDGKGWLFEVKFDGYRALAAVSGNDVRVFTRNGLDWTAKFSQLAQVLARLDLDGVLLDGEVVAVDAAGRSNFSTLQRTLKGGGGTLSYFIFDLLAERGKNLRALPLKARKTRLRALLKDAGRTGPVYFTDHVEGGGVKMLEALCQAGYEGIIAKRADAPYRSGRGHSWLKIKCGRDQEFVIVGSSPSTRGRPFSSLLLATHERGKLRYAGRVGTGFSEGDLNRLARRLDRLSRKTPPVAGDIPSDVARRARWVKPELVAMIAFAEFTGDGLVRQGRFLGLREDKPAANVRLEMPQPIKEAKAMAEDAAADEICGIRLTHPEKVLFGPQGITKRDLARYLEAVAPNMLPHVAGRLASLVRCPQGRTKKCFFQRHGGAGFPEQFRSLAVREKDGGKNDYLYVEDAAGLVAAAQVGVLELHIWGSRVDAIERPDRLVFDLDPDSAVDFGKVKEAARHLRDVLDALGLQSFALLTGGKGIHVVSPLARRHGWPTIKAFARAVAERVVADDPDHYVATMSKAKRTGRIFIDHFRNERGATAISPFSPRAREGAPLAWPVDWQALASIKAASHFRLGEVDPRSADGWATYDEVRQTLKAASLRALGVETE